MCGGCKFASYIMTNLVLAGFAKFTAGTLKVPPCCNIWYHRCRGIKSTGGLSSTTCLQLATAALRPSKSNDFLLKTLFHQYAAPVSACWQSCPPSTVRFNVFTGQPLCAGVLFILTASHSNHHIVTDGIKRAGAAVGLQCDSSRLWQ